MLKNKIDKGTPLVKLPLLITIYVAIISVWALDSYPKLQSSISSSNNTATLILTLKNSRRMFQGETTDSMTVLDALVASTRNSKIPIKYSLNKDNNVAIATIGDNKSSENIEISLNSQGVNNKDINRIFIKPGDEIEIKSY